MKKIPIWAKNKEAKEKYIKDYTLVDDEDYEWLNQYRWCSDRYVMRQGLMREGNKYRKTISMHKQIMEKYHGEYGYEVKTDHKDGNTLNNQKYNLRLCTCQQNGFNRKATVRTSKFKGVRKIQRSSKWETDIWFNGKSIYIGSYTTEEDAAIAYNKKAVELFGEFARLNEVG